MMMVALPARCANLDPGHVFNEGRGRRGVNHGCKKQRGEGTKEVAHGMTDQQVFSGGK
jgi:hypothetical protein